MVANPSRLPFYMFVSCRMLIFFVNLWFYVKKIYGKFLRNLCLETWWYFGHLYYTWYIYMIRDYYTSLCQGCSQTVIHVRYVGINSGKKKNIYSHKAKPIQRKESKKDDSILSRWCTQIENKKPPPFFLVLNILRETSKTI